MHHFQNDTKTFNHQARQPMCDARQNQTNKIADYKETIPNRRLTVKRGVFPYAIHANVVSKQENFAQRHLEKVQPMNGPRNISNERRKEFIPPYPNGIQTQPSVAPQDSNMGNRNQPPNNVPLHKPSNAHQPTPAFVNHKPPQGISANFTNSSTTTEMNKNVLLNQYLTQQYEATVKARKKKDGKTYHSPQIQTHIDNLKPTATKHKLNAFKTLTSTHESKRSRGNANKPDVYDTFLKVEPPKKKYEKPKFGGPDTKTASHGMLPKSDTLSPWKGNSGNRLTYGNYDNYLSTRGYNFTNSTNCWQSSITLSSGSENDDHNDFKDAISGNSDELKESQGIYRKTPSPIPKKPRKDDYSKSNSYFGGCFSRPHATSEEAVNSPSLFFCDDSPVIDAKKRDKACSQQAPTNRFFSFDSVVAKRSIEPENEKLLNPIEFLKCTVGHSKANKEKRKRKKIKTPNPYYSDSTYYGVNPLLQDRKRNNLRFHSKVKNHKAKVNLRKRKSVYS